MTEAVAGPSAAQRARAAALHRKGDHKLCDPALRCEGEEARATAEAAAAPAAGDLVVRGPRGAQLWDALADAGFGPLHRMLLDQTCRAVDRLDRFEAALADKRTWMRFETDDSGGTVVVVVDNAVSELRQTEALVRSLVAELAKALPKETAKPLVQASRKGGGLSDLTAKIAARRDAATG